MTDQNAAERRFPIIAMGFAVAALVIAVIAAVVVIERGRGAPKERKVAASDVVKLAGSAIKLAGSGMQVTDVSLANKLGVATDDVITAISGRVIRREFDVHEALFNTSMMAATTLYIELVHGGKPTLVRWKLDGDLQSARHVPPTASADPVLDTIEKIDDTHVTVSHATLEMLLGDPMKLAMDARIVPSTSGGAPDGFKLYSIRPSSVFARLGFENGDTVHAINGLEISTPANAMEVYGRLRTTSEFVVDLTRRGLRMSLTVTVK